MGAAPKTALIPPTRRAFLRGGLVTSALLATGQWPFPAAWAEPAAPGVLYAGPMQGYVAARSALVWVQTPGGTASRNSAAKDGLTPFAQLLQVACAGVRTLGLRRNRRGIFV